MMQYIRHIIGKFVVRFFVGRAEAAAPAFAKTGQSINLEPMQQSTPRPSKKMESKNFGTFVYFDDVLEKIEDYFKYIGYLKKDDPESYDLHSRVGGQIIGKNALLDPWELPTGWLVQRPAFGMVTFAHSDDDDSISVKLAYFKKLKRFANLQPVPGDIYEVVLYYVDKKNPKLRYPVAFFVSVAPDGQITLVKERRSENVKIKHKQKSRSGFSMIVRQTWGVPQQLISLFAAVDRSKFANDVNQYASRLFSLIAGVCYTATDGVRVSVFKGSSCCVFNVAMERTAYFFKDRNKTVSAGGKTKRIFHVTRAHMRVLSDGRTIPIRMHFRGEREFIWNGYRTLITVNGKHHADINNFSMEAQIQEEINDHEPYVDLRELGSLISEGIQKETSLRETASHRAGSMVA